MWPTEQILKNAIFDECESILNDFLNVYNIQTCLKMLLKI